MSSTPRRGGLNSTALVLIPIAMAINIGIGTLVTGTPLYLDSIGTVLVGALLGPLAGMLTGLLSNAIWTYVFGNQYAFTFSPVAVVIGLLAGLAGRAGLFRRPSPRAVSAIVVGIFFLALTLFVFMFLGATTADGFTSFPNAGDLIANNWLVFLITTLIGAAVGYFVLKNAGYAGIAGLLTGVVAALVSAPIAAYVFGGVTGAGTDALVAAFQSSGAGILQSVLAQGTVSDPFDKMTSFMLVWLIIQAMPARMLQNFPLGRTESATDYDVLNTPRRAS